MKTLFVVLMLLVSSVAIAQNRVVVIPMGGDDGIEPFAPVAKESPPDSDYLIGSESVYDKVTGLEWQKSHSLTKQNWSAMSNYCENLVRGSIFSRIDKDDWRMPSVSELMSIVSYGEHDPAINGFVFLGTNSTEYWSAARDHYYAWGVNFDTGNAYLHPYTQSAFVRCVRIARPQGPMLQANSNDGTATDLATGLMWQRMDDDTTRTWTYAQSYCDGLFLGGKTDWRLPSIKELASIVDYRMFNPAIDSAIFPLTKPWYYWSASSEVSNSENVWVVEFEKGGFSVGTKTLSRYVRCVR